MIGEMYLDKFHTSEPEEEVSKRVTNRGAPKYWLGCIHDDSRFTIPQHRMWLFDLQDMLVIAKGAFYKFKCDADHAI